MSGKRSRDKGARFERKVASQLREIYPNARRGIQTRNAIDAVPDIMDVGPFSVECKHHRVAPLRSALEQSIKDCSEGLIPVAVCKDDGKDPIVLLRYSDFMTIVKEMNKIDPDFLMTVSSEKVQTNDREEKSD